MTKGIVWYPVTPTIRYEFKGALAPLLAEIVIAGVIRMIGENLARFAIETKAFDIPDAILGVTPHCRLT